jgi:uncharacterized protein
MRIQDADVQILRHYAQSAPINLVLLKTTEVCNLNCTYCFMFNLRDHAHLKKPRMMTLETIELMAHQLLEVARIQQTAEISFSFHGGEPTLIGRDWIGKAVDIITDVVGQAAKCKFGLQTNGVLIDQEWTDLCRTKGISIGLSMDGLRQVQDTFRVDHKGRGSYDRVVTGLGYLLKAGEVFTGTLSVIDPNSSGLENYRALRALGVERMDFLFPLDHNWDHLPPWGEQTPIADYLIPIFDEWWEEDNPAISIRYFENIIAGILGRQPGLDALGGGPVSIVSIDTDGGIEPLDSLKACGDGFTDLSLNVHKDHLASVYSAPLFRQAIGGQKSLAEVCSVCPLGSICGGGYLPHRFGRGKGFDNPSVYCRDLWRLISHIAATIANTNPRSTGSQSKVRTAPCDLADA